MPRCVQSQKERIEGTERLLLCKELGPTCAVKEEKAKAVFLGEFKNPNARISRFMNRQSLVKTLKNFKPNTCYHHQIHKNIQIVKWEFSDMNE